ncbi:MAG TPA: NAD(P)-dependent oxidoreductase [Candidatus Binatia bacterium]|nr:NAD(P)-dependent oxidoreductase [Candidatus Binatia bacterium]
MRVLITGVRGFCGRHLARYARKQGASVVGISRHTVANLEGIESVAVDVLDTTAVRELIASGFDVVFHLAFAATPADRAGDAMIMTAIRGTEHLLDALRARPTRLVLLSSAAVYGWASGPAPLTESVTPKPATLYGALKLVQEALVSSYAAAFGLPVLTVRPFNLIGPGDRGAYVAGALATQIVARERGEARGAVRAGYLGSHRDFIDVRDAARACWLLAQHGQEGAVYNVCSGRATPVSDLVEALRRHAAVPVEIVGQADPGPFDIPYHCGDPSRLHQQTGWAPNLTLDQSMRDLLDDLRRDDGARLN